MATKTSTTKATKSAAAKDVVKPAKAVKTKAAATATKPAPAKPAAKSAPKKAPVGAAPAKAKSAPAKSARSAVRQSVTADQRRWYVEVAAYYIAERRNFVGGSPADDWAQAEAEVDRLLAEGRINP